MFISLRLAMAKDISGFLVLSKSYNLNMLKAFRIILFILLFSFFNFGLIFLGLNVEVPKWAESDYIFIPLNLLILILYIFIVFRIYKQCFKSKRLLP